MISTKRFGIVVIVSLMLLNILPPAAWAQSVTPATTQPPTRSQEVAAGFANIIYVPSKVGFCIASGGSWLLALVLSRGTAYNLASDVVRAGCGGRWALRGEDIHFYSAGGSRISDWDEMTSKGAPRSSTQGTEQQSLAFGWRTSS